MTSALLAFDRGFFFLPVPDDEGSVTHKMDEKKRDELRLQFKNRQRRIKAIEDLIAHLTPLTMTNHFEHGPARLDIVLKLTELYAEKDTLTRECAQLAGELAMLVHSTKAKKSAAGKSRGQTVFDAVEKLKKSKSGKGKTNDELFEILAEDWEEDDEQAIRKAYYDYQKKKLTGKQASKPAKGDSKDESDQGNQGSTKSPK